jgi:hypothetical protein
MPASKCGFADGRICSGMFAALLLFVVIIHP